jgi:hypothetical protein
MKILKDCRIVTVRQERPLLQNVFKAHNAVVHV